MTSLLSANASTDLLAKSPIIALSLKITDSILRQVNEQLNKYDLTTEQWVALKLMYDGIASYPSELSQVMGISAPRITKLIDHLESIKLLTRSHNNKDRRKFAVTLSQKGKSIVKKIVKIESLTPLLDDSKLTEEERYIYESYTKSM